MIFLLYIFPLSPGEILWPLPLLQLITLLNNQAAFPADNEIVTPNFLLHLQPTSKDMASVLFLSIISPDIKLKSGLAKILLKPLLHILIWEK